MRMCTSLMLACINVHKANLIFSLRGPVYKPPHRLWLFMWLHSCFLRLFSLKKFPLALVTGVRSKSTLDNIVAIQIHSLLKRLTALLLTILLAGVFSRQEPPCAFFFPSSGWWRREGKICYLRDFSHRAWSRGEKQQLQCKKYLIA